MQNHRYHLGRRAAGFALAALTAISLFASVPACAQSVFVATSSREFGAIDLRTGAFNTIGNTYGLVVGMGFMPSGDMYGLSVIETAVADLVQIDPTSGRTTDLGYIGPYAAGGGMDPDGKLYSVDGDESSLLYSLNPPGYDTTSIGQIGHSANGLLAFQDANHLFASVFTGYRTPDDLYEIDPATGAATRIGSIGFQRVYSGLFVDGALYAFAGIPGDEGYLHEVIRIDTATGAGTEMARYNLPHNAYVSAAAVVQRPSGPAGVPEPGPAALMLALLPLALPLRRRLARGASR